MADVAGAKIHTRQKFNAAQVVSIERINRFLPSLPAAAHLML
jgi:hypothetical protein